MIVMKKVAVIPLDKSGGKIIDSFNTTDDKTKNAPSLNAISKYTLNNDNIKKVSTTITTTNEEQGLFGLAYIDYPEGFDMNNTFVLSRRITYSSIPTYKETKYVTSYADNTLFSDTVAVRNYENRIALFGRLPKLEIGTKVTIELVIMRVD